MREIRKTNPTTLIEGEKYRFVYRRWNGRVNEESIAQFLGTNRFGELILNYRPLAGTATLPGNLFRYAEPTDQKVRLPRKSVDQITGREVK